MRGGSEDFPFWPILARRSFTRAPTWPRRDSRSRARTPTAVLDGQCWGLRAQGSGHAASSSVHHFTQLHHIHPHRTDCTLSASHAFHCPPHRPRASPVTLLISHPSSRNTNPRRLSYDIPTAPVVRSTTTPRPFLHHRSARPHNHPNLLPLNQPRVHTKFHHPLNAWNKSAFQHQLFVGSVDCWMCRL